MELLPEWFYDEKRQIGTDYSDAREVKAYDLRMPKIRDVKREIQDIKSAIDLEGEDVANTAQRHGLFSRLDYAAYRYI